MSLNVFGSSKFVVHPDDAYNLNFPVSLSPRFYFIVPKWLEYRGSFQNHSVLLECLSAMFSASFKQKGKHAQPSNNYDWAIKREAFKSDFYCEGIVRMSAMSSTCATALVLSHSGLIVPFYRMACGWRKKQKISVDVMKKEICTQEVLTVILKCLIKQM